MKLKDALKLRSREVICLVGGGGKTTIMFALAKELAAVGSCVITTTTTRILEPSPSETEKLIVNNDEEELLKQLLQDITNYQHITIARGKTPSGKLIGITREMTIKLAEIDRVSYVIIEADGAAHHSLKAPNETEPVVPPNTSLIIAVAGIDALGGKLEEKTVFRADIAARLLQVPLGTLISPEIMANLITHKKGILKETPDAARIVPFINKVDMDSGLKKARHLAREILEGGNPKIEAVLLGQVQYPDPVIEIIRREKYDR